MRIVIIRTLPVFFLVMLFSGMLHAIPTFTQKGSTITTQHVRFQFLTPTLVRMEYSRGGSFTDAPTAVVTNRKWRLVKVTAAMEQGWIVARTGMMTLRYKSGSGAFTAQNLRIEWKLNGEDARWSPGDPDPGNLGGLSAALDGAREGNLPPFKAGILSRGGFFILDDGRTPVWNAAHAWIEPRRDSLAQDLYCFVHQGDYRPLLRDYAALCGSIPMIPRYTLGGWITDLNYEYIPGTPLVDSFRYTDEDVKALVNRFRTEEIPLDVLVLDFAWHNHGWKGGYDWSPIFPRPKEFLRWAKRSGIKISLNDHPGYGGESVLSDDDSRAVAVRKALGMPIPPPPKIMLDITGPWRFQTDPDSTKWQNNWYTVRFADSAWPQIEGGVMWEDQGYKGYDGIGWYRKWVQAPKEVPRPFYLIFGGVDDEYDLYMNGARIAHHGSHPYGSVYNTTTWTDVSPYLKPGAENLIALRVNDWGGGGGITKLPIAFSDREPFKGIRFNLADKRHAEQFMNILHHPLIDQGADFWWVDGGSGSAQMPGLSSQMWTNRVYYDLTEQHTGKRGFIFSRYGGWGSHRYPALFTGDTYSDWAVLGFEVPFTAQGGNVLMPYITHDIGGFHNDTISYDLWARWLQFGAFSPFLRLHSAHENPRVGNVRMPWVYGRKGIDLARKYFTLRYALLPYIYSYCRTATDSALPLCRPLYLEHPDLPEAYNYPGEYYFGRELLVAPVVDSSGEKEFYLPPGQWYNFFTGKQYEGSTAYRERFPLDDMPVFVRSGAIVPSQQPMPYTDQQPLDALFIDYFSPGDSRFDLYEDDGISLEYRNKKFARTPIVAARKANVLDMTIGPTVGSYAGQVAKRSGEIRIHGSGRPVSIAINGKPLPDNAWTWNGQKSIAMVPIGATNIRTPVKVTVRY